MFSYFSSSKVEDEELDDGVKAVRTSATEQSNISDDECNAPISRASDSSVVTPKVPTTWKQAHDAYCSKHGTLSASIHQILGDTLGKNREVPWALPRKGDADVVVEAEKVAEILQSRKMKSTATSAVGTPAKSSSSMVASVLMSPVKLVSAVASIMRDPDDDYEEWVQEGDDAFTDDDEGTYQAFDLNAPIINLNRTEAAIECLERTIDQIPAETPLVMALHEWTSWTRALFSKSNSSFEFQLLGKDRDLLLQILVDLKRARIIRRETSVIVLTPKTVKDEKDGSLPESLRIALALWDIQKAEEQIEKRLQNWSEQAAECTTKALMYKKQNQVKIAMIQVKKRKMIQQRIDADSRLQLQLLQTRNAIESAQSNRSIIDLMADSTKILRLLREEMPLEQIDDTIDDLQSELDGLQDINDAVGAIGSNISNSHTDDELLAELESLSINDHKLPLAPVTAPGLKAPVVSKKDDEGSASVEKQSVLA